MLSKDNENIPGLISPLDEPTAEFRAYTPGQMVACPECSRNNPPTRTNCLYCGATLPASESADLQKPALRPLEKWEHGYNNILAPSIANAAPQLSEAQISEVANLLKLPPSDLDLILSRRLPLPVSRTGSIDEAQLIQRRLRGVGLETLIIADTDLVGDTNVMRVRAVDIGENSLCVYEQPQTRGIEILWSDLTLFVTGRLLVKRVDLTEQHARTENKIVDASEFFTDELILTFYRRSDNTTYRINTNSFDFSCLGAQKKLIVAENVSTLVDLFRERAPQAVWDDSYNPLRKSLEMAWPAEQQNQSTGLRRERPGKRVFGSTAETSNETQFVKYSRLRHHLHLMAHNDQ